MGTPEALDLVRHDGAWYRKVARKGRSRDLVLQVVGERVYKIAARRDYESVIYEGGGWDYDDCYRVLEPLDTSATDDYHERGGTLYRKERRKAQVGELVLVVNAISNSTYENGDISSVVASFGCGVDIKKSWTHSPRSNVHLYDTEYVVLVPIAHAAPVAPKPPTIDYSREFLGATRESVYEVWARGKAAMANAKLAEEKDVFNVVAEKLVEASKESDYERMTGLLERMASHSKQMAHWHAEVTQYTAMADAAAAKIKERKVA